MTCQLLPAKAGSLSLALRRWGRIRDDWPVDSGPACRSRPRSWRTEFSRWRLLRAGRFPGTTW